MPTEHHASWEPVRDHEGEGVGILAWTGSPIHELEERVNIVYDQDVVLIWRDDCFSMFTSLLVCCDIEVNVFGAIDSNSKFFCLKHWLLQIDINSAGDDLACRDRQHIAW